MGEGTQHSTEVERKNGVPVSSAGTLMLKGDIKKMDKQYVRGATMPKYGPTLYVGVGIPIPILNEEIALQTAISDDEIICNIMDYGVPRRSRPQVKETNYQELKSGIVDINGVEVPTSPLSSQKKALEIAEELKKWIDKGEFLLTSPVQKLPSKGYAVKPLDVKKPSILVKDLKSEVLIIARPIDDISEVARKMVQNNINHLPVVDEQDKLLGIVTSWDIANAVAHGKKKLTDVMTKKVIIAREEEPVDVIARRIDKNKISGLPIIDNDNRVKGMVTAEDISRLIGDESKNSEGGD